jgi:hypothetical protein
MARPKKLKRHRTLTRPTEKELSGTTLSNIIPGREPLRYEPAQRGLRHSKRALDVLDNAARILGLKE